MTHASFVRMQVQQPENTGDLVTTVWDASYSVMAMPVLM